MRPDRIAGPGSQPAIRQALSSGAGSWGASLDRLGVGPLRPSIPVPEAQARPDGGVQDPSFVCTTYEQRLDMGRVTEERGASHQGRRGRHEAAGARSRRRVVRTTGPVGRVGESGGRRRRCLPVPGDLLLRHQGRPLRRSRVPRGSPHRCCGRKGRCRCPHPIGVCHVDRHRRPGCSIAPAVRRSDVGGPVPSRAQRPDRHDTRSTPSRGSPGGGRGLRSERLDVCGPTPTPRPAPSGRSSIGVALQRAASPDGPDPTTAEAVISLFFTLHPEET